MTPLTFAPRSSREPRPVLDLPRSGLELGLEAIAFLTLVGMLVFTLLRWPGLPDSIPRHFGVGGTPDAWGGKNGLLTMPIVATVLYAGLTLLSRYPHGYNYPWAITEDNAARQYVTGRLLLTSLKIELVGFFTYYQVQSTRVATGQAAGLGRLSVVAFIVILLTTIAAFFLAASRRR